MTTRQISDVIEDIYGFEVSESLVSDITDKLLPKIEEWQNRPVIRYISHNLYRCSTLFCQR